jgi:hypothetical protein
MANFIGGIIGLALGAIVLANVYMATVIGTNTSTWSTSEVALWGVMGLVGIIGLLYGALNLFGIL